jgi:hypothetical protein
MMVAMDDTSPLAQQEEGKSEFESADRATDNEITIELYQHNKSSNGKHTDSMGIGSEDISAWDWFFRCFGCLRSPGGGTNFERVRLGERQGLSDNKMSNNRIGSREPPSPRKSFGAKDDRT